MHSYDDLINELSVMCGIVSEYWDIPGNKHVASIETKRAILRAMRLKVDSVWDIEREINERKSWPWSKFIEPAMVISVNNQPLTIPVYIPINEGEEGEFSISWYIEDENGLRDDFTLSGKAMVISAEQWIDGVRYIKTDLVCRPNPPSPYPIGHYSASVTCKGLETELIGKTNIAITPDTCYIPPGSEKEKRWGISLNLYSIHSDRNWGVGDFADLKEIVRWTAELGGGFVGINPLHSIPNRKPFGISPYSPISRLYKNFIYLDIENVAEVAGHAGASEIIEVFKKELNDIKERDLINYERIAFIKRTILRHAFEYFLKDHYEQNSDRGKEFKKYILEEGSSLESFATYMALTHNTHPCSAYLPEKWQEWPAEYRTPSSNSVTKAKRLYGKEILFYKYLQWLIEEQLKEISEQARSEGMSVGIYHDLAIGSNSGGSDAWMSQDVTADGVTAGAPPDDFNINGQNWGFPPLIPEKLKETGYELLIQTIRKNMKYCGALRIDHALGIFRLFWVPHGMSPSEGTYVEYPSEDILRIVALESRRNKTMVIAEDLGTIGENVREELARFQMLSYRLLYFERDYPAASFTLPGMYPEVALCAITTHDLPTIYGYWAGRDIAVKRQLNIYPDEESYQRDNGNRERDKALLLNALRTHGIVSDDFSSDPEITSAMTPELCLAIYEYLAAAPCKLLSVSLDDVVGILDQQNMPGVIDSYPSWRRRMPVPLKQIVSDKWPIALSEMLKRNNR